MGKVFSNDMHAGYKVTLVLCILWALVLWAESGSSVNEEEMFIIWGPLSVWLMVRWPRVNQD